MAVPMGVRMRVPMGVQGVRMRVPVVLAQPRAHPTPHTLHRALLPASLTPSRVLRVCVVRLGATPAFRTVALGSSNAAVVELRAWLNDLGLVTGLDFTNWQYLLWCKDESPLYDFVSLWSVAVLSPLFAALLVLTLRQLHRMCLDRKLDEADVTGGVDGTTVRHTCRLTQRRIAGGALFYPLCMYAMLVAKSLGGLLCSDDAYCSPDRNPAPCSGDARSAVVAVSVLGLLCYSLGLPITTRCVVAKYSAARRPTDPAQPRALAPPKPREHRHKKGRKSKHKHSLKRPLLAGARSSTGMPPAAAAATGAAAPNAGASARPSSAADPTLTRLSSTASTAATRGSVTSSTDTRDMAVGGPASASREQSLTPFDQQVAWHRTSPWLKVDASPVDYLVDVRASLPPSLPCLPAAGVAVVVPVPRASQSRCLRCFPHAAVPTVVPRVVVHVHAPPCRHGGHPGHGHVVAGAAGHRAGRGAAVDGAAGAAPTLRPRLLPQRRPRADAAVAWHHRLCRGAARAGAERDHHGNHRHRHRRDWCVECSRAHHLDLCMMSCDVVWRGAA